MDGQRRRNTPHQHGHPDILQQETLLFTEALCQEGEDEAPPVSSGTAFVISGPAYGHLQCCKSKSGYDVRIALCCRCCPKAFSSEPGPVEGRQ